MSSIRGFYWNTEEDLEYLCGVSKTKRQKKRISREEREDRASGTVACLSMKQSVLFGARTLTQQRLLFGLCRNAVGRRALACVRRGGYKRRRLAAFVLAAVRNKRDRLGCTTVNVGNKTAGIGRRYLIKTIKPVVRFGATGRLSRQGVVGSKILLYPISDTSPLSKYEKTILPPHRTSPRRPARTTY